MQRAACIRSSIDTLFATALVSISLVNWWESKKIEDPFPRSPHLLCFEHHPRRIKESVWRHRKKINFPDGA